MYAEYRQLQLTFLALHSLIHTSPGEGIFVKNIDPPPTIGNHITSGTLQIQTYNLKKGHTVPLKDIVS